MNFERKIKDLQDKLKEKDETEMMKTGPKDVKGGKQMQTTEFANPVAVLK